MIIILEKVGNSGVESKLKVGGVIYIVNVDFFFFFKVLMLGVMIVEKN